MATVPDKYLDLVTTKKALAHLATVMPDGSPQVTPVWFDYTDGLIRVNSAKGRVKSRNMTAGAAVALSIVDPDNGYRYIQIRGKVIDVTGTGGDAHIDALARKYLGVETYPYRNATEVRLIFTIAPVSVQTMG